MDNIYKDFKPSLNEIDSQASDQSAQNKAISNLAKSEFKLSPHAPAFVPRFAIPPANAQQSNLAATYYDNPEYKQNFPDLGNGFEAQQIDGQPPTAGNLADGNAIELSNEILKEDDYYALNELNNFIENISKNPALYEANVQLETDVLNNWILEDPDIIMECVVNNIMDQVRV